MALIVGGQTVTTDEAGTNKLDATNLFGDLPAIDASSLTGITTTPTAIADGTMEAPGNNIASVTAPNPGVAFIWMNNTATSAGTTIGSAKDGGTATAYNAHGDSMWARWITISY